MTPSNELDFSQALGESFGDSICPPVPSEDASPHECYGAVLEAVGKPSPEKLASLSEEEIADLALTIGSYFETDAPTVHQVQDAIRRTLARWPPRRGR